MKPRSIAAAAVALLAVGCEETIENEQAPADLGNLSAVQRFLDVGPDLYPCSLANASARMGIDFQLVEDEGTFTTWIAEGSNGIDSYEMRVGQEGALAGNLLIADLPPDTLTLSRVMAMHGSSEEPEIDIVSPPMDGGQSWHPRASYWFDEGRNELAIGYFFNGEEIVDSLAIHCP